MKDNLWFSIPCHFRARHRLLKVCQDAKRRQATEKRYWPCLRFIYRWLQYQCFRKAVLHRPSFKLIYGKQFVDVAGTFNMPVGFGIVAVAFLATFAKYFSKRWFIWVMGILIAAEVAMFLNAGNQKKSRGSEEKVGGEITRSAKKEESSVAKGQEKIA